ncbi:MAG: 4Fe-4S binding protein, partial [SAR324 cluster bacterium]|nr:4Fe-4S binding protein [SAR324 cluster bacterium]
VCPYHFLAELGESIHKRLIRKKIIQRNHTIDQRFKYEFYLFFLVLAGFSGYTVFEIINPVSALSRAIVYGPGLVLIWVFAILAFEVFYSRRAWCRYFCPVGVSYNLIGRIAPFKIRWNVNKCSNCKKCQAACMVPWVLKDTSTRASRSTSSPETAPDAVSVSMPVRTPRCSTTSDTWTN